MSTWSFWSPQSLPPIDQRTQAQPPAAFSQQGTPTGKQHTALQKLQSSLQSVRVDFDPIRQSPAYVRSLEGSLTGKGGAGKSVQLQTLDLLPSDTALRPAAAFLEEHRDLFGHGAEVIQGLTPIRDHVSKANGVRTVVYEQRGAGIPVFESILIAQLTSQNELLSVASTWLQEEVEGAAPWLKPLPAVPPMTATAAILAATRSLEESIDAASLLPIDATPSGADRRQRFRTEELPGIIQVRWVWLPMSRGTARLSWCVDLTRRQYSERYQVLIDVETGDVLIRRCLSLYLQNASYLVFTSDSPSPFSPGLSQPGTAQPPVVPRQWVTLSAALTNASPLGWIADGENETRGNNVDAALDLNADDFPDLPRPQGNPFRTFGPPLDLSQPAEENSAAAVVQLFYWCNHMHDRLYDLGFTESAGNFQKDNFGRGGVGGDPILADAQDGSGVNNANFTPSPDGEPGRIQMFVFDGPTPSRDGDLDAEIILHEYTHGLSTRLVGGGVGITTLQAGGMGEGWSDFYALCMLSESSDDPDGCYPMGGYVTRQFFGLEENYYYGIRRYPYSTDLKKNPLTFKDIDPAQISAHESVPRSPIFPFAPNLANEVHNQGEVWCVTLWEARALLIKKLGFDAGNRLIMQLVMDGMKLSPPNPNFVQARDAILLADLTAYRGAHLAELWKAFAKRGLGFSAKSPASTSTSGIQEAYDLPDALQLGSSRGFLFTGPVGGPFFPPCNSLLLTNTTSTPLNWSLNTDADWLDWDRTNGTLGAFAIVTVHFCVASNATQLPKSRLQSTLTIRNETSGVSQERTLELRSMLFTQIPFRDGFEEPELDPHWFVSNPEYGRIEPGTVGSPYEGKQHLILDSGIEGLPNRNELTLGLDLRGWTNVTIHFAAREFQDEPNPPPANPFQDGADFDGVAISTNGIDWFEIQGLRDLTSTNRVFDVALDRFIELYHLAYTEFFQIRFNQFDNYPIPLDGIAIDDVELSGVPAGRFRIALPDSITEGDSNPGIGYVELPVAAQRDVAFLLHSSATNTVRVSLVAVVRKGETNAAFYVTAPDNAELDGTRFVAVSAQAIGYFGEPTTQTVYDNESARISLSTPERIREDGGLLVGAGLLRIDRIATRDLSIPLRTEPDKRIHVPQSVIIRAGTSESRFDISALNRQEIEGDLRIALAAEVPGWTAATNILVLQDDDFARLTLELPPSTSEGNGIISGKVYLGGTVPTNVTIHLQSLAPSRLRIDSTIVVPARQTDAIFEIEAIDDDAAQGSASVEIRAQASGFEAGAGSMIVLDDETPPQLYDPTPADGATNQPPILLLGWRPGFGEILVNGDFEKGSLDGWSQQSSSPLGWLINDGNLNPDGPGSPAPPHNGDYSAILAQNGDGEHSLWQDVWVPADAKSATLTWADTIQNFGPEFFSPAQEYRVVIRDLNGTLLATAFQTRSGDPLNTDWKEHDFDLTAFRGQMIRLAFEEQDTLGYMNIGLDDVSIRLGTTGNTEFEVRLGTTPDLEQLQLLGRTNTPQWLVTSLEPLQDYFWQIRSIRDGVITEGPIWSWTTRGVGELDHLSWETPAAVQSGQPFEARLSARDEFGFVITNFVSEVSVEAVAGPKSARSLLITEVDPGKDDQAEFMNVSSARLDLAGWTFAFYDLNKYPQPRVVWLAPSNTIVPPQGLFTLREGGKAPGTYPDFRLGSAIDWGFLTAGVPAAVLVLDASSNVVDFFCAVDADPSRIRQPLTLPAGSWSGAPLPPITREPLTWQRVGDVNNRQSKDWILADRNLLSVNPGLKLPFRDEPLITLNPTQVPPSFFENGIAKISFTASGIPSLLSLRAATASGAGGNSEPFQLVRSNDVALKVVSAPNTPMVDDVFQVQWAVTNTSDSAWPEVIWSLSADDPAVLLNVQASRGATSLNGHNARCVISNLAPRENVVVTLSLVSSNAAALPLQAQIIPNPPDSEPGNNIAQTRHDILFPTLVIQDASVSEGNFGTNQATVRLRLSTPSQRPVRVDYFTSDASALAGKDYTASQGTVLFTPGQTNQTIRITVQGDIIYEIQERFFVYLTNVVNAVIGDGEARITIVDDESAPALKVGSTEIMEGSDLEHPRIATIPVELTSPNSEPVSVTYYTQDNTAREVSDYISRRGIMTFQPGVTQLVISVPIIGDRRSESLESFFVILTNASNIPISESQGIVTVRDDDEDQWTSLAWSTIASTQYVGEPFFVRLTAQTAQGGIASSFSGKAQLRGFTSERYRGPAGLTNLWEFPLRTYFHDARVESLYLSEELGPAGRITSASLNVADLPGQSLSHFTMRMRQENAQSLTSASWPSAPWTTVYSQDTLFTDPGWIEFQLSSPFDYDGTNALLLDFSFDNNFYTHDGSAYAIVTTQPRSRFLETDSAFGSPLDWTGAFPPPSLTNMVPEVHFRIDSPIDVQPAFTDAFQGGKWEGWITVLTPASNMHLQALLESGVSAITDGFNVQESPGPGDGPVIISIRFQAVDVIVEFRGQTDKRYQLEATDQLSNSIWTPVGRVVQGAAGILTLTEPGGALQRARYYRIREI